MFTDNQDPERFNHAVVAVAEAYRHQQLEVTIGHLLQPGVRPGLPRSGRDPGQRQIQPGNSDRPCRFSGRRLQSWLVRRGARSSRPVRGRPVPALRSRRRAGCSCPSADERLEPGAAGRDRSGGRSAARRGSGSPVPGSPRESRAGSSSAPIPVPWDDRAIGRAREPVSRS